MWILIVVIALVLLGGAVAGALVTMEFLNRQRRIMQMKRFRTSVRHQKPDFTAEDKRTMI